MRPAPKKWTHHHTQRLFHISLLATFVFINFVVIYGVFVVLFQASAVDISEQGAVNITATVPGVQPGATVTETGGSASYVAYNPPQLPQPSQQATSSPSFPAVNIKPGSGVRLETVALGKNTSKLLPVYATQNPQFEGTTTIPNAMIFLELRSSMVVRATTYADVNGFWSWTDPEALDSGPHTLYVTAQDQNHGEIVAKSQLDFYISPLAAPAKPHSALPGNLVVPSGAIGNLFDVLVKIPPQFKVINPGDDVTAAIKLVNFGSPGNPIDVSLQFTIADGKGNIVMQSSETVAVATQLAILKTFTTAPNLSEGSYTLTVSVPSKDVIATAQDSFQVKGEAVLPVGSAKIDFTVFFQALLVMLFVFSLVAYFEYNKVIVLSRYIHKIDEDDILFYNDH